MLLPALPLCEVVCVPSIRILVGIMTFVSYVFPPVLGYLVVAALAVTHRTHTLRVLLSPIVASLAWRAVVTVDMSHGEPDRKFYNALFVFLMVFMVTRATDWSLAEAPLARHLRPVKASQSIIMDSFDLAVSVRGYGWDWSRGVHIPRETRPTSHGGFLFYVVLSAAVHAFVYCVLHRTIVSFSPTGIGAFSGGTIFDETLPFYTRYFRSSVISVLAAFQIYVVLQTSYDACTVVAVLVCGQHPAQWPPAFDAPWLATSLCDFWGRRWHQFLRRIFLIQGGYPLSFFLGRVGLVVGAFLSSAVMHHIALVALDNEPELWRMVVGFGMMAPGVLAEGAFKRLTGRKVGGWAGWAWTMGWLLLWGNVIVDGFARAGMFAHFDFTGGMAPGQAVVERLVANFDRWLHEER